MHDHARLLMTPAQHRAMAAMLREKFSQDPETPDLAAAHDQIATAIEGRRSKAS